MVRCYAKKKIIAMLKSYGVIFFSQGDQNRSRSINQGCDKGGGARGRLSSSVSGASEIKLGIFLLTGASLMLQLYLFRKKIRAYILRPVR